MTESEHSRQTALWAAAQDFEKRAKTVWSGQLNDPLAWAIWTECDRDAAQAMTLDDPWAIAAVAYEACALLLGFVDPPDLAGEIERMREALEEIRLTHFDRRVNAICRRGLGIPDDPFNLRLHRELGREQARLGPPAHRVTPTTSTTDTQE